MEPMSMEFEVEQRTDTEHEDNREEMMEQPSGEASPPRECQLNQQDWLSSSSSNISGYTDCDVPDKVPQVKHNVFEFSTSGGRFTRQQARFKRQLEEQNAKGKQPTVGQAEEEEVTNAPSRHRKSCGRPTARRKLAKRKTRKQRRKESPRIAAEPARQERREEEAMKEPPRMDEEESPLTIEVAPQPLKMLVDVSSDSSGSAPAPRPPRFRGIIPPRFTRPLENSSSSEEWTPT